MVYYFSPFASDKNLGQAYNQYMELVPNEDDWVCFTDGDICFLHEFYGNQIEDYIRTFPEAGIFTCYTNRIKNENQRYAGMFEERDISEHLRIAELSYKTKYLSVTEINSFISGMVMVFKKSTWLKAGKFGDGMLKVDNRFSYRVLKLKMKIYRMNGVYVFHKYRMGKPKSETSHLK